MTRFNGCQSAVPGDIAHSQFKWLRACCHSTDTKQHQPLLQGNRELNFEGLRTTYSDFLRTHGIRDLDTLRAQVNGPDVAPCMRSNVRLSQLALFECFSDDVTHQIDSFVWRGLKALCC